VHDLILGVDPDSPRPFARAHGITFAWSRHPETAAPLRH